MPSDNDGPAGPASGLPPHLDPRRGRPGRASSGDGGGAAAGSAAGAGGGAAGGATRLPPELDPRGRRVARAEARAQAGRAGSRGDGDWRAAVGDRSSVSSGAALGLRIAVAALSLAVLLGSGFAWATYRNFTSNIRRVDIGASSTTKNIDGKDQNILIVGNDDRSNLTPAQLAQLSTNSDGGSLNTDTMMLLHVPANGSQATVISFPRDSYVSIPGHGKAKLNAAYPDGVADGNGSKAAGAALLRQTIEGLTGLTVDHFVQVDLIGFYSISNAIGGVTVCLNAAQGPATRVGQEGPGFDSGYEPNGQWVYSYSGINLPAGKSTIKGPQALAFVRQRHGLPQGDLDRIKRQQYFLSAVFRKLATAGTLLNPIKLENLLGAVEKSLTVDTSLDLLKLAQQLQNLSAGNVKFTTIPTSGFANVDGVGSVVVVNNAAIPDFIDTLIGQDPNAAYTSAKTVDPRTVSVDVFNGSGVSLRATNNTAALKAAGFSAVVGAGDPAPQAATTIQYPTGLEAQAKTLAAQVPGATVTHSAGVTKVTLTLGANNIQVKSLMATPPATSTAAAPTTKSAAAAPTTPAPTSTPGVTTAADAGCIN